MSANPPLPPFDKGGLGGFEAKGGEGGVDADPFGKDFDEIMPARSRDGAKIPGRSPLEGLSIIKVYVFAKFVLTMIVGLNAKTITI